MNQLTYARICVNIPHLTELFDYKIPENMLDQITVGSLVTIPFGRQTVQGIVMEVTGSPHVAEPKSILSIVEEGVVITRPQITLAEWMAEENLAGLSTCLALMLPPGLSQEADVLVHLIENQNFTELTPTQKRIIELLRKRGDLRGKQLDHSMPRTDWRKSLPGLIKKGWVTSQTFLSAPTRKTKTIRAARFIQHPKEPEIIKRLGTPGSEIQLRRQRVLDFLEKEATTVNTAFVCTESGANAADLKLLEALNLIQLEEMEFTRDPLAGITASPGDSITMTAEQKRVVDFLEQQVKGNESLKPTLLQGVTGSGKTEVYLQLVEKVLSAGRQAIILVPEISLTPQTVNRFLARFPGKVALIHSRLSPGERYDTWRRIRSGELQVAVGPRSALFVPFAQLGAIIIDECHDGSYHQEDFIPHYGAVSAALAYARITNSVFLMGSATPQIEQLHLFRQNHWNLFELPKRVMAHQSLHPGDQTKNNSSLPLPDIEVVDMRAELVAGNRSSLSRSLQTALAKVLEEKTQAILFLNQRGSSTYVFCRDCGHVLKCSRCNTPMTFHENQTMLACHHCNNRRLMPSKCPQCDGSRIKQYGLGTESLQKLVAEQFPQARLLRWDADTSKTKGAHTQILDQFLQHEADILIGTQMLAKGLDLPNVTLVGVILADVSLNMPDFRAAERTFQLLTQVAGRAGRSALGGRVVLQTFHPEHYAIRYAAAYDFFGFEKTELAYRKQIHYPPFANLIKIELRHANQQLLENTARQLGDQLLHWIKSDGRDGIDLIGPAPCFYQRIAGEYRWQIIIRGAQPQALLKTHPIADWQSSGMKTEIIVDPVNLL